MASMRSLTEFGEGATGSKSRSKSVTLLDPTDSTIGRPGGSGSRGALRGRAGLSGSGAIWGAGVMDDPPTADESEEDVGAVGGMGEGDTEADEYTEDEDRAAAVPMLPRAAYDLGHEDAAGALRNVNNSAHLNSDVYEENYRDKMEDEARPTGLLAWVGFGLAVFALANLCISFASPYWLQQWPMSFNEFQNMGLWEVCFHNYMHFRDDSQEIYNGCWWVFNTDPQYRKLREWLLPPWFLACQVMTVVVLLVQIAVVLVVALVFLHMCPMMNHEYHQIFALFISGALEFFCTMTVLIVTVVFGSQCGDRRWLPRPDWNFLSWGFGFMVITGMLTLVAGLCLFLAARAAYEKLIKQQNEYFKNAMELSSMYPAAAAEMVSYGPGGAGYDKPSYSSQPSYAQDQPSYGKEQPSYEKGSYGREPSYEKGEPSFEKGGYGREPSYGQEPSYEKQASTGGQSYGHQSYDGQQGYGPQLDYGQAAPYNGYSDRA